MGNKESADRVAAILVDMLKYIAKADKALYFRHRKVIEDGHPRNLRPFRKTFQVIHPSAYDEKRWRDEALLKNARHHRKPRGKKIRAGNWHDGWKK